MEVEEELDQVELLHLVVHEYGHALKAVRVVVFNEAPQGG
jgi:hypothetical protein